MAKKMVSFSIPDELADEIYNLRATEKFKRCSIAEVVRYLINRGLESSECKQSND